MDIKNNTISGNGINAIDKQNGIYLSNSQNVLIQDNVISGNSRSAIQIIQSGFDLTEKIDSVDVTTQEIITSDVVVIIGIIRLRFNELNNSKRGLLASLSKVEVYSSILDGNQINGVEVSDSSFTFDQSTVKNTILGPGIFIAGTVISEYTGYFIGNNSYFTSNNGQAIYVTGQGFLTSIKNSTFQGNSSFIVEAPIQTDTNLFQCASLNIVSGTGLHSNLTSNMNNKCNL